MVTGKSLVSGVNWKPDFDPDLWRTQSGCPPNDRWLRDHGTDARCPQQAALNVAVKRGQFESACVEATASVLSRNLVRAPQHDGSEMVATFRYRDPMVNSAVPQRR